MLRASLKYSLVITALMLLVHIVGAQKLSKDERAKLFAQLADDEKAVAACTKATRDEQIKKFGKPFPKLSGHCWGGCPVRVVKPRYPENARLFKISGEVLVNTIVDEKGDVVWAKVTKGSNFLRQAALEAAYVSQYQPKVTCGNKPVRFRWTIKYYFYPGM